MYNIIQTETISQLTDQSISRTLNYFGNQAIVSVFFKENAKHLLVFFILYHCNVLKQAAN